MGKKENCRAEQHHHQNEQLLTELMQEITDGIILWDESGRFFSTNAGACRILECTEQEILPYNYFELLEKSRKFQEACSNGKDRKGASSKINVAIPSGKEKILEVTCRQTESGYYISIFRDATNHYKIEKELRTSEQKFQRMFEDAVDGLLLWDDQFHIVDLNAAAEMIFGYSKEQLVGSSILRLFVHQAKARKEISSHLERVIFEGKYTSEITYQCRDGSEKQIELLSQQGLVEGLNLTFFRDVTEKKVMQEQLRKSDTLNVIGELAAGIAHEIRNPMTSLKGFIQLLEESLNDEHSMYFQVITSELERIDSIINEFLVLAKPHHINYSQMNINGLLKETADLLNPQAVLHNVQVDLQFDRQVLLMYGEQNQLKKVFINLIKNAIEVMPNGGTITISTEMTDSDFINISITDQGEGIPPHKIKKLGEPFYTTKERGTGLGLMVSFKIIKEHHGTVNIESIEGKGTTFSLRFPVNFQNKAEEKTERKIEKSIEIDTKNVENKEK